MCCCKPKPGHILERMSERQARWDDLAQTRDAHRMQDGLIENAYAAQQTPWLPGPFWWNEKPAGD